MKNVVKKKKKKSAAKTAGTLQITTPSDRELAMTRVFDARRSLVFDALLASSSGRKA